MTRILAVMQLRDEAWYLPGCLDHLRDFVDGVVAFDDGSADATGEILAADPLVASTITKPRLVGHRWDELGNRRALLERARELGAEWVVCVDADERFERSLLAKLRALPATLGDVRIAFWCRELWDRADQYRVDGVWAHKVRPRMFPLPPAITYDRNQSLHGSWEPDHVQHLKVRTLAQNFYHLKMIRREDRIARRDFYNRLDPERAFQPMGYDYLADETGLKLASIPTGKEYDYATLPPELRATLSR